MANGMIYLLTGKDRSWGKSQTLIALTSGNTHQKRIDIVSGKDGKTYDFFIRRMSNTDDPESFIDFIGKTPEDRIISAFSAGDPLAQSLLQVLSARYHIRCFVLHHRWSNPADVVTPAEMALLAGFAVPGGVYDYTPPQNPAADRAADFLAYMQAETPF